MLALLLITVAQQKWSRPYKVVTPPVNVARFAKRLGSDEAGVFLEGRNLTFVGKHERSLTLPDWMWINFERDNKTSLWFAQAEMSNWDQAFFTYQVGKESKTFLGRHATKLPQVAKDLRGSIKTVPLMSKALGESRDITVYLPPVANRKLNAVYMADGQGCKDFAQVLEPLILSGKVAPTAIIGLHHGPYKGTGPSYDMSQDYRAREYLKVADPERFAAHLRFVLEEVMPWAEAEYGLVSNPKNRTLFGFSNGGAFVVSAIAARPDVFGSAIPCSVAAFDRKDLEKTLIGRKLPVTFLSAGTLESFIVNTSDVADILKRAGNRVRFDHYVSGHEFMMWQLAFTRVLPQIFPNPR